MNGLRVAASALLVIGMAAGANAQLSGAYTIDPAGSASPPNYQSFAAASAALGAGVSGPVTFTVASTTFNEAVTFNPVTGSSSTNTISFVAVGAPAVIDANAAQDGLQLVNNCSYFSFDNFVIQNFTRYGLYVNSLTATRATFCTFKNITVDAPSSTSSLVNALRNNYGDDCTFENCVFKGGGYVAYSQQQNRCFYRNCEVDGKGVASRLLAPFNSNDADNLYENCFFHDCGPSGFGLNINLSQYGGMFWHNTVIVTTSQNAVHLGGCCAWSRANSFRNNIVINKGTGVCIKYGGSAAGVLEFNDADYNCYYAPNGMACELENGTTFTKGTLAQWKTFFAANKATLVPAGGPPAGMERWDDNSIEADPLLTSDSSPYDIHLTGGSPCLDGGTTTYVAGPWISYNPAYLTATDFEGDARPATNVDIGADEVAVRLIGSGTAQPGTAIAFTLIAAIDANRTYQMGTSLGAGPIPIDTRQIGLSLDPILVASVLGTLPSIFQNYAGVLDGSGNGAATLNIPAVNGLVGVRFYSAFVTVLAAAPSGISNISNTFSFSVQP